MYTCEWNGYHAMSRQIVGTFARFAESRWHTSDHSSNISSFAYDSHRIWLHGSKQRWNAVNYSILYMFMKVEKRIELVFLCLLALAAAASSSPLLCYYCYEWHGHRTMIFHFLRMIRQFRQVCLLRQKNIIKIGKLRTEKRCYKKISIQREL